VHLASAQVATCGGAGPYADAQLARVRAVVGGTSTLSDTVRASYNLPAISPSSVQWVTRDSVCALAASALRQTVNRLDVPLGRTWVIQVGPTRYWVYDPRFKSAIDVIHAVFDETWTNLSLITG
jgi:hypothetical protein